MKKMSIVCGAALLAMAATACKKSDDPKPSDKPAEAKVDPKPAAPAAPAAPKSCADYGGTGKGEFGDFCKLKGPAPFEVTVTGNYADDFGVKRPEVKITNKTDHETSWGSITIWYYDKDGKLVKQMSDDGKTDLGTDWNMNGSGVLNIKPGESTTVAVGMPQDKTPPEAVKMEAEVTGWGWDGPDGSDKGGMFFDPHDGVDDFQNRPVGGWK